MAKKVSAGNGAHAASPPTKLEFPEELKNRARELFANGAKAAYTLNYDYAIELYLDGLAAWPDALEEGHKPLLEIALRRQAAGGKKSGFGDSSKYKKGSTKLPKDALLKAEYLLCKDPENAGHATDVVKACLAGEFFETGIWMADYLFESNHKKDKPVHATYTFLRDSYVTLQDYNKALNACSFALQLKPNDANARDVIRDLSAQATMQRGKYDGDSDFRESIKDREAQLKLQEQDQLVQTADVKADAVNHARQEYDADPKVPGKIAQLVDALCATEETEQENKAVAVLEKAQAQLGQFSFRQRIGEVRIKQIKRRGREVRQKLKGKPDSEDLKLKKKETDKELLRTETDHYKLCVENYPTDLGLKHEYGKRLLQAKEFDDAIPMFQEARSDPRFRIPSLNYIGLSFFHKEWYPDAIDSFISALEAVEDAEGNMAKELRYNLGRAHEADGNIEEALGQYRKVAQIDFNYRDVRNRVDELREK